MSRVHPLSLLVLLALPACDDSHSRPDAGEDSVLCVARGVHLTAEGCLTPERGFAEEFVAPDECLNASEERCLQALPDSGVTGAWLFSGDYYEGITNTEPCDETTLALAQSAPACDASSDCTPCDASAGALCALAPPCE